MKQGIYDREGVLLGYIEGDRVYDRDGVQTGYRRGAVIYAANGDKVWTVEGDGLYVDGASVGYLGSPLMHDE